MSLCPYMNESKQRPCPVPIHCAARGCYRMKLDTKAANLREAAKEAEAQGEDGINLGVDWGSKSPTVGWQDSSGFAGTASLVHDGTWDFEKRLLERCERVPPQGFLITVHSQPRGLRGRYLALRTRLWKWGRPIRRYRRRRKESR